MKGSYSDFARKQLEKYGWSEGNGVGKTIIGRSEPVKAYMKRDSAGLGFDPAAKHTSGWWDDVFAQALDKVPNNPTEVKVPEHIKEEIKPKKDNSPAPKSVLYRRFSKGAVLTGVTSLQSEESLSAEESSKKKKRKRKKKRLEDVNGTDEDEDQERTKAKKMKDDRLPCESEPPSEYLSEVKCKKRKKAKKEKGDSSKPAKNGSDLFHECGGMTLHPSSRHGVGMSGKLARVARMEAELLSRMQTVKA